MSTTTRTQANVIINKFFVILTKKYLLQNINIYVNIIRLDWYPGVAKFGIALEWGSRGRWFKSSHSDQAKDSYESTGLFFIVSNLPPETAASVRSTFNNAARLCMAQRACTAAGSSPALHQAEDSYESTGLFYFQACFALALEVYRFKCSRFEETVFNTNTDWLQKSILIYWLSVQKLKKRSVSSDGKKRTGYHEPYQR